MARKQIKEDPKIIVGKKLKELRNYRSVTQSALAAEHLTRNMLSQIERGAALPSYATIVYLSHALSVDPSYFFTDGPSLHEVIEKELLVEARAHFDKKDYAYCLSLADGLDHVILSEFSMILCHSCYYLGVQCVDRSDFAGAEEYFRRCEEYGKNLHSIPFTNKIRFYRALIRRFSGTGSFNIPQILSAMSDEEPFAELVKYVFLLALIDNGQIDQASRFYDVMNLQNLFFRSHINARLSASVNNYLRAKQLLWQIADSGEKLSYPFLYAVYNDLERYCKATDDYEGAYRCAVDKQKYSYLPLSLQNK